MNALISMKADMPRGINSVSDEDNQLTWLESIHSN